MKICSICVLPETFPGILFDADGACNYCRRYFNQADHSDLKRRYRERFLSLCEQVKQGEKAGVPKQSDYDVLMAYSGGKDSSYTLKVFKEEFNLKVLALTFDNGFLSPLAMRNAHVVCESLGMDHMMVTPGREKLFNAFRKSIDGQLYPMKALERASSICNTCMNLVKSYLLKTSIEMGVPFIGYGWSPGQAPVQSSVMKWNTPMVRQIQEALIHCLKGVMGDDLGVFILGERHFKLLEWESEKYGGAFLYNIHPLAFLDYDEEKILEEIRGLGWQDPKDTDSNSTNCLLNSFANQVHQEKYGFHPYAFEIAGLVREGYLTRETGMAKLATPPDPRTIALVKERLG